MNNIGRILEEANSVLLIDWNIDVPITLLRAGFAVFGQEPTGWLRYQLQESQLEKHPLASPPERADLVFCYRPVEELADYIATAKKLGAKVFWYQSGLVNPSMEYARGCWLSDDARAKVRRMAEDAGLICVDEIYVADAVRALDICKPRQTKESRTLPRSN
jgi:predicted CoA-binding protein